MFRRVRLRVSSRSKSCLDHDSRIQIEFLRKKRILRILYCILQKNKNNLSFVKLSQYHIFFRNGQLIHLELVILAKSVNSKRLSWSVAFSYSKQKNMYMMQVWIYPSSDCCCMYTVEQNQQQQNNNNIVRNHEILWQTKN